jgi:hypothetical protein
MVFVTIGVFVALVIVVVVAAMTGLATTTAKGAPSPGLVAALGVGYLICLVLFALAALAATAATYGMADAAWERGTATFANGVAALGTRTGALFVATIGFVAAVVVVLILLIPTLGLAMLALPVVTMYVFAAVVCGGRRIRGVPRIVASGPPASRDVCDRDPDSARDRAGVARVLTQAAAASGRREAGSRSENAERLKLLRRF